MQPFDVPNVIRKSHRRRIVVWTENKYDQIDKLRGMDVTIVTSAKTDQEGLLLLRQFGFPFQNS